MSSPIAKNPTVEGVAKPGRDTERCGIARASRLPTHARSPSTSGQRSKIPTNIGHIGRPGATTQSQVQDGSRLLTSVASEETAGGNGSPINTARRLTSRSVTAASSPPAASSTPKAKSSTTPGGCSSMQKRQMENQFATKRKRYGILKKELTDKQKNAADLYEEISQLRDKLIASGGKDPGKIEMTSNATFPSQNCLTHFPVVYHALRGSGEQTYAPNSEITSELVASLESKIRELSNPCFEVCKVVLQKRSEILQWLEKLYQENTETKIDPEVAKQVDAYLKESSELEARLEETKKAEETAIADTIVKLTALWNEVEVSRARIHELEVTSTEIMNELHGKIDAALAEKNSETEKRGQLAERKHALESELQKVKARIRAMESRASEDETRIGQLQNTVKNLEGQLKQKESSMEQRFKELQKSLKNSESLLAKTEKQRDSFESRLNDLKKSHGFKETEAENRLKQLSDKLDAVTAELKKQIDKSQTNDDAMDRRAIIERDEKIATLRREKEDIIALTKILPDDADLVFDPDTSHEEIVKTLKQRMQTIATDYELLQKKLKEPATKEAEPRSRGQTQIKDSGPGKSSWSSQVIDLQEQIHDLRCSISELKRRNEELEILLNQKQLQIEEQDRTIREQDNVKKVRDEVIALMRGQPDARGTSGEYAHHSKRKNQRDRDEVDKQIAEKTENLQQLYSTLETKQRQITRLETLVKQMEIQQDRSQEQRTRLEKQIAQLQLSLHYRSKGGRYGISENLDSSPRISSAPFRESAVDQRSAVSPTPEPGVSVPRSFSRSPPPRSPTRRPQMQRSKTLNSFQPKSKVLPNSKELAFKVIDDVARTLERERAYENKKRAMRDPRKYSRGDRESGYLEDRVDDTRDITKDDIHESFYNWLVEPWLFEGQATNLIGPTSDSRKNHWPGVRSPNSDVAVNVDNSGIRSPRRQRATNDCSRESRCGSPECRRQSASDWNSGSVRLTRMRNTPHNSPAPRSRLQRT